MASINYAARQISVKIVYYGPGLSGKTTNLQVIHKKTPQEHRSDMVSLATETDRTLFFDFLPLDLGKIKGFDTKFQLYTVPGQVYYNATRKLVLRGVDGVVFVADSGADKIQENLESFQNLEDNLAEYGYQRESIPIILQYNKRDLPNALPIEELQRHINKYNLPYGEGIAYKGVGVFDTLKQIGKIVIDYLNKKYSRGGGRSAAPEPAVPIGGQQFAPPPPQNYQQPAPAYQAPQAFAPPPMQGYQQPAPAYQAPPPPPPPVYQAPMGQQFASPPPQGYQSYEQPAPVYQAPPQAFAPPPPPPPPPVMAAPQAQQSYDTFEAFDAPSFEPPPQQQYQSFGGSQFAPPPPQPAPQYQASPTAPQMAYDPMAAAPPPPSFDVAAMPPAFEAPSAPAYDPFAQQNASPWAAEQAAAPAANEDPFLAAQSAPSFEMQMPPPAPPAPAAAPPVNYDDVFMVEPPLPPPQAAPPPPQQQAGGGYEQSPFGFEMASPPPPPSSMAIGQIGGNEFNLESFSSSPIMGGQAAVASAAAPQNDFSFNYQPAAPSATQSFPVDAPSFGAPAAPAAAPLDFQPADPGAQNGSELDLEIEMYQREIEEKQKKMRATGGAPTGFGQPQQFPDMHEMQPYAGAGDNRHQSQFQQAQPEPQPYNAGGAFPLSEFEAELNGGLAANKQFDMAEECPTDSAMFFTSVDRQNVKPTKPVKLPVNPAKMKAQQQQKGFVSKLFNKNR